MAFGKEKSMVLRKEEQCGKCGGKGFVKEEVNWGASSTSVGIFKKPCPRCGGTGRVVRITETKVDFERLDGSRIPEGN